MTDFIACPDCGHRNPHGARSCEHCNFPLVPPAVSGGNAQTASPGPAPAPAPPAPAATAKDDPPVPIILKRPRRPRPRGGTQIVSLWLMFGVVAAMALVWLAIKTNLDRTRVPVEGAKVEQQQRADELRAVLAKDSTNIAAHVGLGDVLYDTGNWPEAIIHYRAAVRRDSSLTTAIVDLGVCYYNLGVAAEAEKHFLLALQREPHQPIALFNLGIINERREDYDAALRYFHSAMQSSPPDNMQEPLMEAMQRIQQKTGRTPPPLPEGR